MRLPQAFRGLFRRHDDPELLLERRTAGHAPDPGPARSDRARLKHFERRLRELTQAAERPEPLIAGRLQIIALARVKQRLGRDWPRLATRVHRLTRQLLDRRLAEADVYVRAAGDRYIVLFAKLTSVEATFKAQAIARELSALLIGELPPVDEAPVQVTVHEIDPGELSTRPTLGTLVARMDAESGASGMHARGGPGGPRPAPRGALPFDYLPIWSRRGRAIVGYLGGCRQDAEGHDQERYEVDCLALRSVLAALSRMEGHGHAAVVIAPVHWDTLVQLQRRPDYLDLCRQMPPQLNRRLGFAASDVAAGAWRDQIRDRLQPLKPFARFFLLRLPPEPAPIRDLAEIGLDALAFDNPQAGGLDAQQRERLESMVRDAARHKLATCALGIGDRSAALALLAAGVDFLGGDAVAPRVRAPGPAYRLELNT